MPLELFWRGKNHSNARPAVELLTSIPLTLKFIVEEIVAGNQPRRSQFDFRYWPLAGIETAFLTKMRLWRSCGGL
jgi:hypothetical protein